MGGSGVGGRLVGIGGIIGRDEIGGGLGRGNVMLHRLLLAYNRTMNTF